jgi:ribosomal-protein-alanine N-acetyltransferase
MAFMNADRAAPGHEAPSGARELQRDRRVISLRAVGEDDSAMLAAWKSDPYIRAMALDPESPVTAAAQRADIRAVLKGDLGDYSLILLDGRPIGYVRADWMNDARDKAWLRFALGAERGRGLGRLALGAYVGRLLAGGCRRVEAEVYATNAPSIATLEAVGFRREGTKRQAHFDGERYVDVHVYGLLAEDLDHSEPPPAGRP